MSYSLVKKVAQEWVSATSDDEIRSQEIYFQGLRELFDDYRTRYPWNPIITDRLWRALLNVPKYFSRLEELQKTNKHFWLNQEWRKLKYTWIPSAMSAIEMDLAEWKDWAEKRDA